MLVEIILRNKIVQETNLPNLILIHSLIVLHCKTFKSLCVHSIQSKYIIDFPRS